VTDIDEVRHQIEARVAAPVDDRERASAEHALRELHRLPSPFDEHADMTHLTASAFIVGPRGIVLHLHKRLGVWLQPGGHIDQDESPADAALRESSEETGLKLEHADPMEALAHIDVHQGAKGHTHLDLRYLLRPIGDEDTDPAPPPDESQAVRWFGWDEAIAIADDGLAGALRALRP
jgi:8-oxo-dGTP pyrophosphatase MutT (NUDIX family)